MDTYTDIEQSLKATLDTYTKEVVEKAFSSDRDWTSLLKQMIGKLGEERFNCKVCASGFKDIFEAEWLFDLVWYKEEGELGNRRLVDVPLVMECEWNKQFDHIKYDFEKLLIANARHRLFICYVYIDFQNSLVEYFKEAVHKYSLNRTGDRYLIAIMDKQTYEFRYELIVKN